jgi:hypothetical protein
VSSDPSRFVCGMSFCNASVYSERYRVTPKLHLAYLYLDTPEYYATGRPTGLTEQTAYSEAM